MGRRDRGQHVTRIDGETLFKISEGMPTGRWSSGSPKRRWSGLIPGYKWNRLTGTRESILLSRILPTNFRSRCEAEIILL